MSRVLYVSIDGLTNILNIRISTSHTTGVATAIVTCGSHSVNISSKVYIYMGYTDASALVFTGYVKQISRQIPEDVFTITIHDVMARATDFFIAPSNPSAPISYTNIPAENLVRNVFELAGLTNYSYDVTYFTFGIHNPVEVKLVTSYEFNKSIADLLAWHIYADMNEVVYFKNRLPYVVAGDVATRTITNSEIITSDYSTTEVDLRNRVVVYGSGDIYAEASAISPYLPTDFYKTTVYANPYLVQDSTMAQDIANYNLSVLNKLTYKLALSIIGRYDIMARDIVSVTDVKQGLTNDLWYAFAVEHTFSRSGYITQLELRK